MAIEITRYEDWMRDQVIQLFVSEYKVSGEAFGRLFDQFYFHPFQKDKCILIAAIDDKKVAGFQSFFFWPYTNGARSFNSYQSGNSLIHPDYRGQGLFNKMLAFIETEKERREIDFLMGFPVEASKRNFLKDQWTNLFDLRWHVRFCNPFGFFSKDLSSIKGFSKGMQYPERIFHSTQSYSLDNEPAFTEWRRGYMQPGNYYTFRYEKNGAVLFHVKMNKRKGILNEAIIGDVICSTKEASAFVEEALRSLIKALRQSFAVHFMSIAVNEASASGIKEKLLGLGFKSTDKTIHFIVKPLKEDTGPASGWNIYRADIDTW